MKIEKRAENLYRVRQQINGKRFCVHFDHKPSQNEVLKALAAVSGSSQVKGSFSSCAESYIKSKENVISPSTIKGYRAVLNGLPEDFKRMKLSSISQIDVQKLINDYSVTHKPKTVRNAHGFISAVLRQYRPEMVLSTTLPQKIENTAYIPTEDDIRRILDASKDNPFYHIAFQLGVMGLRRSEICALDLSDIQGNTLSITKALVEDENNEWVIKQTKTAASTREIYIPDSLVAEIMENGKIYSGYPNTLVRGLHKYQDRLSIPRFRFHDLRHFFASYAHSQGVSDADIMATGGWKSDFTMKSVYRHEMKQHEAQKQIFKSLLE